MKEQEIIETLKAELLRLAPAPTPWRSISAELGIQHDGQIITSFRVYEGLDGDRPGMKGNTLAEVEEQIRTFDPLAKAKAELAKAEARTAELRAQIAAETAEAKPEAEGK